MINTKNIIESCKDYHYVFSQMIMYRVMYKDFVGDSCKDLKGFRLWCPKNINHYSLIGTQVLCLN